MRTDENGAPCPATLYEYRNLCRAIGGADCAAVKLLDKKIEENGGVDDEVIVADSQMRALLMPLLLVSEMPTEEGHARLSAMFLAAFGKSKDSLVEQVLGPDAYDQVREKKK